MSVYKKLIDVQSKLKAPKNQRNNFGNYNYRSCEDILEALKPILAETKATIIVSDEIVNVGDRYYVKATVRFIDTESGETVEASANAREEDSKKGMDSSQLTGSTSSYARKYALNGMFAIDDTKDSDSTNTHGNGDTKASTGEIISEGQVKRMYILAKGKNTDAIGKLLRDNGYGKFAEIEKSKYNAICEAIEKLG